VSVEVWDPRTLQPLDVEGLVASVKKTNRVAVAHEAVTRMGFGAEIAAVVGEQAFDWLDAPVSRVTGADLPMPYSKPLEQIAFPHEPQVVEAVRALFGDVQAA
jgi:pyruvate dehydrogenase E1 component beta subunit